VGHSGDGLGGAEPGPKPTELSAEVARAVAESERGHTKRRCGAVDDMTGATPEHFAAADIVVRTQPEPRSEVVLRVPARPIHAHLADYGLDRERAASVHAPEIDARDPLQFRRESELRRIAANPFAFGGLVRF